MSQYCSLCGNINENRTFKGGVICKDCLAVVRSMHLSADTIRLDRFSAGYPSAVPEDQPADFHLLCPADHPSLGV